MITFTAEDKKVFAKARDILSSEDKWCQKHIALTKDNRPAMYFSMTACRWCLMGAVCLAEREVLEIQAYKFSLLQEKLHDYIVEHTEYKGIAQMNDNADYQTVITLLDTVLGT